MIKIDNLVFRYAESLDNVIDNVSVNIEKGSFTAVLGHNGSGKSTLAKHTNAILLPLGGAVYVEDMDTKDENLLIKIRQTVGMVFQNPDNQIVATIVEDDVAFAPENIGVPPKEIRERVDQSLKAVGMSKFYKEAPHLLSGGQKQRIAIAGVLAMRPKYIVLDEPTAMLDPVGRREVLSTLKKLNKEQGMTVVLITHNMDEAVLADRVIVMDNGHIEMDGTPKDVFAQVERIKELGLDVPQVTELMFSLKQAGLNVPSNVLTIDEAEAVLKGLVNKGAENKIPVHTHSEETPAIEVDNMSHDYSVGGPYEKKALQDITMYIPKGKIIGIIGHTGSGKSTLVQHFNGLLKPSKGTVKVDGTDIADKKTSMKEIRSKVGVVFQYPEHQLFEETVKEDIAFGPKNLGLPKEEIERRVIEAAESVGISEKKYEKSPFDLSGGQKRRVAIAGVLAMEPDVLILDEPTAGLDPKGRRDILALIKKMHKEKGITIIIVSHGMEDIANTVDLLYVLNEGKIAMHGTPMEVYSRYDELEKIGLSAPQVTKLIYETCGQYVCTVEDAKEAVLRSFD
ncbi:MAG: energy-coupling factor transporter ATPase [Clostridia bacterium]|nr:energy-coupling factor transporter ATPase [Clostridia bacterium]